MKFSAWAKNPQVNHATLCHVKSLTILERPELKHLN